jgi:hypothetical protein
MKKQTLRNKIRNIALLRKTKRLMRSGRILDIKDLPFDDMEIEYYYNFTTKECITDVEDEWNLIPYWGEHFHDGFFNGGLPEYYTEDAYRLDRRGIHINVYQNTRCHIIDGKEYTSLYDVSYFNSKKTDFGYGYYEIYAKLPTEPYYLYAFWLTGVNSWPPEIDIFEIYTKSKKDTTDYTIHYINDNGDHEFSKCFPNKGKRYFPYKLMKDNYFYYGLLWEENEIKIYINRHLIGTLDNISDKIYPPMRVVMTNGVDPEISVLDKLVIDPYIIKNIKYYRKNDR